MKLENLLLWFNKILQTTVFKLLFFSNSFNYQQKFYIYIIITKTGASLFLYSKLLKTLLLSLKQRNKILIDISAVFFHIF